MKRAGTKIAGTFAAIALLAGMVPGNVFAQTSSSASSATNSYSAASGGGSYAVVTLDGAFAGNSTNGQATNSQNSNSSNSSATVTTSGGTATAGNGYASVNLTGEGSGQTGTSGTDSTTASGGGTSTTTLPSGLVNFPGFPCFPIIPGFPNEFTCTTTSTSTGSGGGNGGGTGGTGTTTTGGGTGGTGTTTTATSTVVVVTPSNMQGWATYGLTASGTVSFVTATGSPLGTGALELTTGSDVNSVTHIRKSVDAPLALVNSISYATKQLSAADQRNGNATLRLSIDLNGDGIEDDQLMFEPYFNGFSGSTGWNTWTISRTQGNLWSNYGNTYSGKGGENVGYATNFTLADVLAQYPNAHLIGLILSMGTNNVSQNVLVDNLVLATASSTTTYDFDPDAATTTTNGGGTSGTTNNGGSSANGTNTRTVGGGGGGGGGFTNFGSTGSGSGTTNTGAGQVLGASTFHFTRDLHIGMTGADVTELQAEMIALGQIQLAAATGYFGQLTRAAVIHWQFLNNIIPAEGYFGPISRAKYAFDGAFHF